MNEPAKTLGHVLKSASDFLRQKQTQDPDQACMLLAARLLNCKHLEVPLHHDLVLSEKQLDAMRRGVRRLAAGEPIQYIVGETEFMGHVFKTDRRALIPRPETELLVETVLQCEDLWSQTPVSLIDIGTGSGCIVISLALAQPQGIFVGIDPDATALELAVENAELLGATNNVTFASEELSESIEPESMSALVANLPYVTTSEYEGLPVHIREHEPRQALDGGADGLNIIRDVVQDAAIILRPGGHIFLETGCTQTQAVKSLLEEQGFIDITVSKDLADRDRVVSGKMT